MWAVLAGGTASLGAQIPALPTDRLGWDQVAPSLLLAEAYEYAIYIDAGPRTVLLKVSCTGLASPFVCVVDLPALTPGMHTLELTAAEVVDTTRVESARSLPLSVRVVVAPTAPATVRIVRTP